MKKITLYHAVPSRGLVVHWLLEELQVPYEINQLDLDADQHKQPEYLAINPMGKVPALLHGDRLITETAAICMYLAEQFPEKGLDISKDSALRGEYLRWMFFAPVTIEPSIVAKAMNYRSEEYQPFADIEVVAETLVNALAGRKYLVGDAFSAVDVVVGSAVNWGLNMMPVMPKHPELVAYWENLEQRPAWQVVRATMG